MTMNRCKVVWSNFSGGPGLSTFYFDQDTIDMTALRSFFSGFVTLLPSPVTIQVPNAGDKIAEATGELQGIWAGGPVQAPVNGSGGTGNYSGASGAVIEWLTGSIVAGRRPLGKTFIVPIIASAYDANGSLGPATITTLAGAAATLLAAYPALLKVWSRPIVAPVPNPPVGEEGHVDPRAGAASPIVAARVPDLAAVLRSRRT